ncbi:hypothetical protein D9Q98_003698 [Chlorella vulgaris]|uniref:3-oxoacyl-[acyl-carrier-protein] reductase n=1 Tax=Chlorella vulgaris TaxID=3077 RepID=A0A9D4TT57_CHLVU|nr:hypothetical protein D9Q98_003698 [Chlorella vulgaris]
MSKKLVGELLKGRVALVTGSSTGIGIGILRQLAAGGATTVMHGLEPEAALQQKAAAIAAQYGTIVGTNSANLLHPQEVRDMIARVQEEFGRLDILVNNAGIQHVAPVHEFPEEKWNAIIEVILNAPYHATKAALPAMIDAGWGRIVNTGSMHALVASPFKSAYNAAKHGVAGLTKTVALEVATKGVTVNAVCPGYVMTELIEKQLASQAKTRGIPKEKVISDVLLVDQPIKRFVKSEEVGALVRHLCTDDAAAITGACLSIDGGWTAR